MAGKQNLLVAEALRLMDEEGLNAYSAAKRLGLTQSTVYSAFARRKLVGVGAMNARTGKKATGMAIYVTQE